MKRLNHFGLIILVVLLSGCQMVAETPMVPSQQALIRSSVQPSPSPLPLPSSMFTPTVKYEGLTYWFDEKIPTSVQRVVCFPDGVQAAMSKSQADLWLDMENGQWLAYQQVFSIAGRFNLLQDSTSIEEIQKAWKDGGGWRIAVSQETYRVFSAKWGESSQVVIVESGQRMIDLAWSAGNILVILPFEELDPHLKSLQVGGISIFDKDLDVNQYPLTVNYYWNSTEMIEESNLSLSCIPGTNRQVDKMSTVLMTGVTALTRGTAARMAEKGVTYPAGDILDWLKNADITHISNEVSFFENCPDPLPIRAGGRFCAQPEFFDLLIYSGVDIVELTGNHLNDWGTEALADSISKYLQAGIKIFGGGMNEEEARKPLLIETNGNRLAFIGCNSTGPETDWATGTSPGSAACGDMDWLVDQVKLLREEDYLPIVTFQGYEVCDTLPHSSQRVMADRMVEAGAVIVSGSQAHCPQGYRLEEDTFIHYGLGNLWFDQMDWITRQETLDLHVFYDGRHIGTVILTAMLEDSARPRPMTAEERQLLLENLFDASDW